MFSKSANEIWDIMKNKFAGKNLANAHNDIQKIASFIFPTDERKIDDSLTKFIGYLTNLKTSLGSKSIDIDDLGSCILTVRLPEKLSARVLNNIPEDTLIDVETLKKKIDLAQYQMGFDHLLAV